MTTDTPRTDAVMASSNWPYHITSEMQKLERVLNGKIIDLKVSDGAVNALTWKLKRAEAEVERLKKVIESL